MVESGRQVKSEGADTAEPEATIRRILVAIDTSADSLAALAAAVELASELEAELEGMFVEDVQLLRVAGLSLTQGVDLLSAEVRRLEEREMERHLRIQAALARQALRRAAERRRLRWSFHTARGRVIPELRTAAERADLVILGVRGWSPGRGPGSTVWSLLREPSTPVMVMGREARFGRSMYCLVGDSPNSGQALGLATALTRATRLPLTVLILAEDEGQAVARREKVEAYLAPRNVAAELRLVQHGAPLRLADTVRAEGCGLFIVPRPAAEGEDGEDTSVRLLLGSVDCPVVLVG
ncbi:MAG: universal stress protein [Gemmatimonadota bacterium]|nr:MAG: universal stress protein [Gemmatimonadota bacterium]